MTVDTQEEANRVARRATMQIIATTPGFTPPSQARTRETTLAIVIAASELLRERDYSKIRMQDVAERAGCAVTSIYARFADKSALLGAIHLLLLQECRPKLDAVMHAENFADTGLLGLAHAFVEVNECYFDDNFNFVVAAVGANRGDVYTATANIMDAYAQRLATAAAPLVGQTVDAIVASVKLAIHVVLCIYRDSVMGSDAFERPSRDTLARTFVFIVEQGLVR